MKIMNLYGTIEDFNGETLSWVSGEIEYNLAYNGNDLVGIEVDGIEKEILDDIVENLCDYDFPATLECYNGDTEYIGKIWGELDEEEKIKLLGIANVWEDVKEGDCIVDFTETLAITGYVVNEDNCQELKIKDDAKFYNPIA